MGGRPRSPLGAEDTRVLIERMPRSIWPRDQRRVAMLVSSGPLAETNVRGRQQIAVTAPSWCTTRKSRSEVKRAFAAKSTTTAK
jgi:hypothetical protein